MIDGMEQNGGAHGVTRPTSTGGDRLVTSAPTGAGWRMEEANRRLGILQAFNQLVDGGLARIKAAKKVGRAYSTIWAWLKRFDIDGYEGLIPQTDECGRKTELEKLGFTAEQVDLLMRQVEGLNLDTESTTTALRLFAHSDRCPENLAAVILDPNRCSKHAIPPSIRRAATPTENSRLAHRGPRSLDLKGLSIPRRLDILPGDIFCPDDTTPIFGWWVPWVESEEYPFGVKLLQGQLLRIIDVASQCPVGRVLIAREKSSYRASDIWAWVGFMADDVGLPRLGFQMERGSWDATLLQGVEVEESGARSQNSEGEVSHAQRVGGLRQLPSNVTAWHQEKLAGVPFPKNLQTWTSYLPKSKSIEAYFNRIQALEGCLYGSLGRDQMRRPFEKAKKLFQQCSRPKAKIDPRQHFLSGTEIMARLNAMDDFLANEPMEGEVFHGVPRQKLELALRDYPLYQMPEESRWLYRRDWKRVTITQGWARCRLTDPMSSERYSLFYINPAVFAEIEGRDVIVYYDREKFESPAQIIAASRFTARGREFVPGDFVCSADYFERVGTFLDGEHSGHDIRKRWRSAVMTIYGRASIHAPSRRVPEEIAARREDGRSKMEDGKEGNIQRPTFNAQNPSGDGAHGVSRPTMTVDGRPPAVPAPAQRSAFAPRSPEELARQRNNLSRQAENAKRLNAMVDA